MQRSRICWYAIAATLLLSGTEIRAQTGISLASQSKDVDFTGAPFTKPLKSGTLLPGTCSLGELFFKSDAPAGSNIFACTSANVWSLESGLAGLTFPPDFQPVLAGNQITVGAGRVKFGMSTCLGFTTPASLNLVSGSSGTGVAQLYIADSCAFVLEYPNSLTLSFTLTGVTAQAVSNPGVPATAFAIAAVNISNGQITSITDLRAAFSQMSVVAGTGAVVDCTTGPCLISLDPAVIPQLGGANTYTGSNDMTNASRTIPAKLASADPGTCTVGEQYFNTTTKVRRDCTATNTWGAPLVVDNVWMPFAGGTSGGSGSLGSGVGIPSSNGASLAALTGATFSYGVIQFTHAASSQFMFATYRLHDAWNGGNVSFELNGIGGSGSAGNAFFTMDFECLNSIDLVNSPSFTTGGNTTIALDGTGKRASGVINLALSGCSPGGLVTLRINRNGSNGADTFTGTTSLLGMTIKASHN